MKSCLHFALASATLTLACSSEVSVPPATSSRSTPPSSVQVSVADEKPLDFNAIAFRKARKAAEAAMKYNWSTANTILDSIDMSRVDDTDTLAYVDYCKRCARIAQDIGVSTKSNPDSLVDTAVNLDLAQLAASTWAVVESKGWSGAAQLAVDAKRVRDEIPMWQELDSKLLVRYGSD